MRATIAKNESFGTVGLEVTSNGRTVFQYGVKPNSEVHFIKQVDMKTWEPEICALIELNAQLQVLDRFKMRFFDVLNTNDEVKELIQSKGLGFKFGTVDEDIERIKNAIQNIVNNIR